MLWQIKQTLLNLNIKWKYFDKTIIKMSLDLKGWFKRENRALCYHEIQASNVQLKKILPQIYTKGYSDIAKKATLGGEIKLETSFTRGCIGRWEDYTRLLFATN